MTAPKKIWANVTATGDFKPLAGEWNYKDVGNSDDTEYTRSDLIPTAAYVAGLGRVQHVKRGSTYEILGRGKVQANTPLADYAEVVVYRGEDDGLIWVRPVSEFEDGRFSALSARPDAPDVRVVTVAQLERWYGKMGNWTCQDEIRTIIGENGK